MIIAIIAAVVAAAVIVFVLRKRSVPQPAPAPSVPSPPPIDIDVYYQSALIPESDVIAAVAAVQIQIDRDFAPVWGIQAKLHYPPSNAPGAYIATYVDADTGTSPLGVHSALGPGAIVYVPATLRRGWPTSLVFSHEILEMLGNTSGTETLPPGSQTLKELCDAVEGDACGYTILGQLVSDFVFPSWFDATAKGPYDQTGKVTAPLQVVPPFGFFPAAPNPAAAANNQPIS